MGIFIALQIIMGRFVAINLGGLDGPIRISFGFLPVAISSMVLGPFLGGIVAALADIIGIFLFPVGKFFIGYTLSAFLRGFIYGWFLYKKPKTIFRVILACTVVNVFDNIILGTLWYSIIQGVNFMVYLPIRSTTNLILLPIHIITIYSMSKLLTKNKIL